MYVYISSAHYLEHCVSNIVVVLNSTDVQSLLEALHGRRLLRGMAMVRLVVGFAVVVGFLSGPLDPVTFGIT